MEKRLLATERQNSAACLAQLNFRLRCSLKNVRFGVLPLDRESYCVLLRALDSKGLVKFKIAVAVLEVVTLYCIALLQKKNPLRTSNEGSLVVVVTWFGLDNPVHFNNSVVMCMG